MIHRVKKCVCVGVCVHTTDVCPLYCHLGGRGGDVGWRGRDRPGIQDTGSLDGTKSNGKAHQQRASGVRR